MIGPDSPAATSVLALHLTWILWVIFGALWTRGRPGLAALHISSLIWGIIVETGPWPCPLTLAEEFFERRAGVVPYHGGFLLHYLDRVVYPNLPIELLTACGVLVCGVNLAIYVRRWRAWRGCQRGKSC